MSLSSVFVFWRADFSSEKLTDHVSIAAFCENDISGSTEHPGYKGIFSQEMTCPAALSTTVVGFHYHWHSKSFSVQRHCRSDRCCHFSLPFSDLRLLINASSAAVECRRRLQLSHCFRDTYVFVANWIQVSWYLIHDSATD